MILDHRVIQVTSGNRSIGAWFEVFSMVFFSSPAVRTCPNRSAFRVSKGESQDFLAVKFSAAFSKSLYDCIPLPTKVQSCNLGWFVDRLRSRKLLQYVGSAKFAALLNVQGRHKGNVSVDQFRSLWEHLGGSASDGGFCQVNAKTSGHGNQASCWREKIEKKTMKNTSAFWPCVSLGPLFIFSKHGHPWQSVQTIEV